MSSQNDIQQKFNQSVIENKWFTSDDSVVIGVSAGVDSMALLNLMMDLPLDIKPKIIVAHVNHQLRKQSVEEQKYIEDFCRTNLIELHVGQWKISKHPKSGIELAARNFRYNFFSQVMSETNSRILLTAHHANDQAETVLMRLIRGSFIKNVSGILKSRHFSGGKIVRPLLKFKKIDLISYMKDSSIKWYEDETNQELDVSRNRIRHILIPFIESENKRGIDHINEFSKQLEWMKKQNNYFLQLELSKISLSNSTYSVSAFMNLPDFIQTGIIDYLVSLSVEDGMNFNLIHQIVTLLNNIDKPQGVIPISGKIQLKKEYDKFLIENIKQKQITGFKNQYFVVTLNKWYSEKDYEWMITDDSQLSVKGAKRTSHFYLLNDEFPLIVQNTQNRDRITLKNGGHQTAKRLFINSKIPVDNRKNALSLMTDQGKVLAVLGYSESVTENSSQAREYTLIIK